MHNVNIVLEVLKDHGIQLKDEHGKHYKVLPGQKYIKDTIIG